MSETTKKQENLILWDWFSLTSKIDSPETIKKLIGMEHVNWTLSYGFNGYLHRYFYEGVNINFHVHEKFRENNPYDVQLDMSGSGCRTFETFGNGDWQALFDLCKDPDYHLTRLDVAYDDFSGLLDLKLIDRELRKNNYLQLFKKSPRCDREYQGDECTIYFGSHHSDVVFRIYNKKEERHRSDLAHWVRFEIQLRRDSALLFLEAYRYNSCNIGRVFSGYVSKYVNFLTPSKTDTNKSRWKLQKWWSKFIAEAADIPCYSRKDIEYNALNLDNYVFKQAGSAVETCLKLHGIYQFLDMLKKRGTYVNPKYKKILEEEKLERALSNSNDILEYLQKLDML